MTGKGKGPSGYEVGFGKPPRCHQFPPGRSGNPKGRPPRALGKHQQLVEAMDQPTRDMFMEEMHRSITVTSDGKKITMPAIQMITRAMVKSAAEGGQQAQRSAIMFQLEFERQAAAINAEYVTLMRQYKEDGGLLFARIRSRGLPEPDLLPHPDDIYIDEQRQRVEIRGPSTPEQKAGFDKILAERDSYQRGVTGLSAEATSKPRDWTPPVLTALAQEKFDLINNLLPERYRKTLEGRLTRTEVDAARERARKAASLAARKRRQARGRAVAATAGRVGAGR